MEFENKAYRNGDSISVRIPHSLAKYFDIAEGTEMILKDDEDKIILRKK